MAKGKILVIDDDQIFQMLMNLALGKADFEVISAQDGESGISEFKQKKPDLVIVDIALPDTDGFQVVTQIRDMDREGKRIPIIVVTAHDHPSMREHAQELGVDLFLPKPINSRPFIDDIDGLMPLPV